jgi:hypothetical protein
MTSSKTLWSNFDQPFHAFGPLLKISDIADHKEAPCVDKYYRHDKKSISEVAQHVINFLAQPNPNLGRSGNVCPYMPESLQKNLCRITATKASERAEIESAMALMQDVFVHMAPSSSRVGLICPGDCLFKAIIVVFTAVPNDKAEELIGGVQKRLKPHFIRAGLMIGQFYPNCPVPGLNSPTFRPLQMPVPTLAIRHITKFDAPFMMESAIYINDFVNIFGDDGARRIAQLRRKISSSRSANHTLSEVASR